MKCATKDELIAFEERVAQAFRDKKINAPVHLCSGNEEHLIMIFEDVHKEDYVFSTHRNHYHYLLKGGDKEKLFDEICGKKTGICGGKGRSMHIFDTNINFYSSAIVSGVCAIAAGVGVAIKHDYEKKKVKRVPQVWCFVGDGAEDSGYFVEAVRFCNSRQLPVTFIIEDNDFAVESTKKDRWHTHAPINAPNILRYEYTRQYPHVGIGERVAL